MPIYKLIIGIDPGVTTGYAEWLPAAKGFSLITSYMIHEALNRVKSQYDYDNSIFVRVEDARLRKWIPKERDQRQVVGRARGSGSVSRDCKIWEDFLKDYGIDYEMVAPKNNKTKTNAVTFKNLTGWQGQTNNHGRDAAMLCFQYQPLKLLLK